MNKKHLTIFVMLAAASSIALGVIAYKAASAQLPLVKTVSQYDWVMEPTSEYAAIEKNGMEGNYFTARVNGDKAFLIDEHGKKLDETETGWIDGYGDVYTFTKNGQAGCKNLEGKVLIPPTYDYIDSFDGGYAESYTGYRHFAIDTEGRVLYRTPDDEDLQFNQISGRYFGENYRGKFKVIDVESGKMVKEWNEAECEEVWCVKPGLYLARGGDSDYFLDENFEVTFDGGAYEWGAERVFSEGLCYVEKIKDAFPGDVPAETDKLPGYIDEKGQMVIEAKESLYGSDFSEGKAVIYSAKKAWVIDRTGKKLFTKKMKKNLAITGSSVDDVFTLYVYILNGSVFQHGLVPLYDGKKMGLADEEGKWVLEPVFDDMDFVGDRLLAVEYHGKWGMIRV